MANEEADLLTLWLVSYQWVATVIQALISFGLGVVVARYLGVDQFGVYAIATSAGFFITILLDGGFTTLLQRESARASLEPSISKQTLSRYSLGYTCLAIAILLLIALVNPFNQNTNTLISIIFAFSPVVLIGQTMSVLRGHGRLARDAILQVMNRVSTAFFVIFFVLCGLNSPQSVLFAQGIGGFILYFILAFRSKIMPLFFIPSNLFRVTLPIVAWAISYALYLKSDLLLCRIFDIPRSNVGSYGIACRLIESLQVFAGPFGIILFRKFRISDLSREVSIQSVLRLTYTALAIGVIISSGAFIFSPTIIPWVFGIEYESAVTLFEILSIGLIFFLSNTVLFQAFIAFELQRILMIFTAFAGIFSILMNSLLLPMYGVEACAWTSVLTQFLLSLVMIFTLAKSK